MAIFSNYINNLMEVFMDDFFFFVLPLMSLVNLSTILKIGEEVNLILR